MTKVESIVKFNMNSYQQKSQKADVQDNNACAVVSRPQMTKYSAKNLQAYYCSQPSFGYLNSHHIRNCGAYVDEAKKVFFSLFTYADVEKVFVVLKKAGTEEQVDYQMTKNGRNIFRAELQHEQAKDGDQYAFKIVRHGKTMVLPDPRAHRKTDFLSPFSEIYDHHKFEWADQAWMAGANLARISRLANSGLTPVKQARIYEMNIPAFSKEGTFDGAIKELEKLIERGVFKQDGTGRYNAVEIMPLASTYKPGWGYDAVYKGAVMEEYGGPDGLKRFIDYLHSQGISAIIDTVPNHFGDDGNRFREIGSYFRKIVDPEGDRKKGKYHFGSEPNFEKDPENNSPVRDFISDVCGINWLRDYHFDGIRLDYTNLMESDYALIELVKEAHFHNPHCFIIAEDDRVEHVNKLCSPIHDDTTPEEHVRSIQACLEDKVSLDALGLDGRWGYEVEHSIKRLLIEETGVADFYDTLLTAIKRGDVIYGIRQSHDEIGNMDAIRAVVDLTKNKLNMFNRVAGHNDTEKGFSSAQATQAILTKFVSGQLDSNAIREIIEKYHVVNMPSIKEIEQALISSIAKIKVSESIILTIPNVAKMQFMGSIVDVMPFRFFRTFSEGAEADYRRLREEKGYHAGEGALRESKLDSITYAEDYNRTKKAVDQYQIDLNDVVQTSDALKTGKIVSAITNHNRVLGIHIKGETDEFFTVSNLASKYNDGDYEVQFPQGKWQVVICSEDAKYAGSGQHIQTNNVISEGKSESKISLPANSFTLFKKIS